MSAHPAVDIVTGKAAVVIQDRALVPLSTWLTDAMGVASRTGLALQVLSTHEARITLPLRMTLSGPATRWVVQEPDDEGYFDGFSGLPLEWDGGRFALGEAARTRGPSPTFAGQPAEMEGLGHHLIADVRVIHPATGDLELGGAVELFAGRLAGAAPASWGTSEPALTAWQRAALTELCRRRAPDPTWLIFVGPAGASGSSGDAPRDAARPFLGTMRVSRVTSGVKETITFAASYGPDDPPPMEELAALAGELAGGRGPAGTLLTMTAQWAPGRADLTYPARWFGAPVPVALAVGPEGVAEAGLENALAAAAPGRTIGDPTRPAVWYELETPDGSTGWPELAALMQHLTRGGRPA